MKTFNLVGKSCHVLVFPIVMLLASNVITLMHFSYYSLLSAYLQVCIKYEYITSALYYNDLHAPLVCLGHGLYMLYQLT